MHFLPEDLDAYIVAHSEKEPVLLQQLAHETYKKVLRPRMLSGHYQGRVLSLLSKLIRPKNILEIGTYTGYSALCLCEGLQPNGQLHTIDRNEELAHIQKKYFDNSSYTTQIVPHIGNALHVIPKLDLAFDLVFIDADKPNYVAYFNLLIDRLPSGAVLLSDNVLWSGKVVEKTEATDKSTIALLEYNKLLANDPRVETVVLPIRDGLTLSRVL